MIINIDHIALNSLDIQKDEDFLLNLGYKIKFKELNVKNLPIKRELMSEYKSYHDLTLLLNKGNFPIELIYYGHINNQDSGYFAHFGNINKSYVSDSKKVKIGDALLNKACLSPLKIDFYYNKTRSAISGIDFKRIVVETSNLKSSITYWENFGFKLLSDEKSEAIMEFKSLFDRQNYYIQLVNINIGNKKCYLDNRGFACLAFITNSAKEEKKKLLDDGIMTTAINKLKLNGRLLNIFFAKNVSGEIAELIEIKD